ncbi:hypothetical protein FA13DRAFT_1085420 [Coprinellus micaceus]|uniref:Uncharacterized protein n=1 Tax=Coprinellus micaceus TaxID=71717 RepID=A0A4Y7TSD6_COPMI|nr:hypothetical protein FA13DRAFT_1085420 [Coprinellus micaceus]
MQTVTRGAKQEEGVIRRQNRLGNKTRVNWRTHRYSVTHGAPFRPRPALMASSVHLPLISSLSPPFSSPSQAQSHLELVLSSRSGFCLAPNESDVVYPPGEGPWSATEAVSVHRPYHVWGQKRPCLGRLSLTTPQGVTFPIQSNSLSLTAQDP